MSLQTTWQVKSSTKWARQFTIPRILQAGCKLITGEIMAGLVSNLIEVLRGQVELYSQIAALSVRKKDFIVANDIDGLRDLVAEENKLVPKALRGDKDRERIMKDICTVLNKPTDMTLSYLVTLMEGQPEHDELGQVVENLRAAADEMKELNESNKVLIQHALEFVDYNINVIHSSFSEAPAGYNDTLDDARDQVSFLDLNG